MCGILGSINVNLEPEYLDLIEHRGPDGSGRNSFVVNNNIVELAHRRLCIIDLTEAGKQPMFSSDKKICIIFNGEIYNHLELKEKLEGLSFNGHSDTETIVNYFQQFNIRNSLADLKGIFAFACIDFKNELLYLARDRFGIKPLYYWLKNNQLLFSSEIRPLKAYLNPKIDNNALINCLRMRYIPSPSTIYKDIHKVAPGELLTFDLKKDISVKKTYFVQKPTSLGSKKGDFSKLVLEYGELFEKAVEKQLMSDVEIGILLSGGIDSALVGAIAKSKSKTTLKAFTVGFEDEHQDIDEINYAEETSQILGFDHFHKRLNFEDFTSSLQKIINIVEEPIATTSIFPMYALSKLASSKVKVVLSGQGADEPLGGYNKYKGLFWLEKLKSFKYLISLIQFLNPVYTKFENFRRLLSALDAKDDVETYIELNSIFSKESIEKLLNSDKNLPFSNGFEGMRNSIKRTCDINGLENSTNIKDSFLYYDLRTSLADDLLMYTDKITMHFSMECRVPILDNDLIYFIETLDNRYKFNSRHGKIIHKAFAKEYLPAKIIERKKMGFKSPTESWFRVNVAQIESILNSGKIFSKLFNMKQVKFILESHIKGENKENQISLLLSLFYVLENNYKMDVASTS